jgi:hypothetical protein
LQDLVGAAIGVSAKCLRQRANLPLAHKAAVDVLNRTGVGPEEGYSTAQVQSFVRGVTSLFLEVVADRELRRRFALGLKRRLPPGADLPMEFDAPAPRALPEAEPEEFVL